LGLVSSKRGAEDDVLGRARAEPGRVVPVEKAKEIDDGLNFFRSVGIGPGTHYLQEDNPHLIGEETRKFLQEVLDRV
jgi:hypothetical protein